MGMNFYFVGVDVCRDALVCFLQNSLLKSDLWPQSSQNTTPTLRSEWETIWVILFWTCPAEAACRSRTPVLQSNQTGNTKPKMKSVNISRQWKHLGIFSLYPPTKTPSFLLRHPLWQKKKIPQQLCFVDSCHDFVSRRSMCGHTGAKCGWSQPDNILGLHHHSLIWADRTRGGHVHRGLGIRKQRSNANASLN